MEHQPCFLLGCLWSLQRCLMEHCSTGSLNDILSCPPLTHPGSCLPRVHLFHITGSPLQWVFFPPVALGWLDIVTVAQPAGKGRLLPLQSCSSSLPPQISLDESQVPVSGAQTSKTQVRLLEEFCHTLSQHWRVYEVQKLSNFPVGKWHRSLFCWLSNFTSLMVLMGAYWFGCWAKYLKREKSHSCY